jgi:hypothetical protein
MALTLKTIAPAEIPMRRRKVANQAFTPVNSQAVEVKKQNPA